MHAFHLLYFVSNGNNKDVQSINQSINQSIISIRIQKLDLGVSKYVGYSVQVTMC